MDSNIWDQMKMEWAQRSDARTVPERWGTDERLGGLTPAAMVELAHGQGDRGRTDELLAGLVRLAATDELAARTVVQIMLPGIRCLARRTASPSESSEDRDAAVIEGLWRRVRTYPWWRRQGTVAGNLSADILMERTRAGAKVRATLNESLEAVLEKGVPRGHAEAFIATERTNPGEELLGLLSEAVRARRLDRRSASLIARCRMGAQTATELASQAGIEAQSLRRNRQRAEGRLMAAVA